MTIRPVTKISLVVAACVALPLMGCERPPGDAHYALVGGTVIDGTGQPPIADGIVIVRGQHIETVGARAAVVLPEGIRQIDVSGRWVLPGFIDAHAHAARWTLPRYLAYGVTAIRDMHGDQAAILSLAEQANLNAFHSPRFYVAGAMIDGVPAARPGALEVSSPIEGRRAVDQLSLAGVDLVKTFTLVPPDVLDAVVNEARSFQLPVAAHLGLTDARDAARLGVASIEHLSGIAEAASANAAPLMAAHRRGYWAGWTVAERSWSRLRPAALKRVAEDLADAGVILVPTLIVHDVYGRLGDPGLTTSADLAIVPDSVRATWTVSDLIAASGWNSGVMATTRLARQAQNRFLRDFVAAGGRVAVGSNAAQQLFPPGLGLHTEIELLVAAGLSPSEALVAATANGALLTGEDSLGTIRSGRVADLVILERDPLSDIRNTRSVERIILRGNVLKADSIRASW